MLPAEVLVHWPREVWSALADRQRPDVPLRAELRDAMTRAVNGTFSMSCEQADALLLWLVAAAESGDVPMATRVACGIAIYRVREALRVAAM